MHLHRNLRSVAAWGIHACLAASVVVGLAACSSKSSDTVIVVGPGQVDRMGRPGIATLIVKPARKDEFNKGLPANDASFRADAVSILTTAPYSLSSATATALAGVLFPDVLSIDTSTPTAYLNGRRLQDDVIDASLNLLTNGAVTTDNVSSSGKHYTSTFPFMGPPIQPGP